jgi:O-antigen/teichoic acid export membrane protein
VTSTEGLAGRLPRPNPAESTRADRPAEGASDEALLRSQVRGSTLLLAGRILQLGVNMAVQLMVVRYLSKAGYGAFAYALAIVMVGETIALFGLDRAVSRLVPISLEKRDYATACGVLVLSILTVVSLGVLLIVAVILARGVIERSLIPDHRAVTLLALMIVLSPIQALDDLLVSMFSVLARPRAIFVRT